MSYVAKVSLPGVDVKTATPEQCAIHSSFPPLKSKSGQPIKHYATLLVDFTGTIPQGVFNTLLTVPHSYGYIPFTLPNIVLDVGLGSPIVGIGSAGIGATLAVQAYSDTNNFYITIYDELNWVTATSTLEVSYYIFAENGT